MHIASPKEVSITVFGDETVSLSETIQTKNKQTNLRERKKENKDRQTERKERKDKRKKEKEKELLQSILFFIHCFFIQAKI